MADELTWAIRIWYFSGPQTEKQMINMKNATLTILAIVASGTATANEIAAASIPSDQAAAIIAQLVRAGHVSVDVDSGRVFLKRSTLDVLRAVGSAQDIDHSARSSECSETTGSECS